MPKKSALSYAIKLLATRDYTEKTLSEKLRLKGYSATEIVDVVAKLKALGYIDDFKVASSLCRHATNVRHLGIHALKALLQSKGIDNAITDTLLAEIDEYSVALQFAQKKLKTLADCNDYQKKQKLYNALMYRGFSEDVINQVIMDALHTDVIFDDKAEGYHCTIKEAKLTKNKTEGV